MYGDRDMPRELKDTLEVLCDELVGQLVEFEEAEGRTLHENCERYIEDGRLSMALIELPTHFPKEATCALTFKDNGKGRSELIFWRGGDVMNLSFS